MAPTISYLLQWIQMMYSESMSDVLTSLQIHFDNSPKVHLMILPVTFVGESAVDDGGPRREYFKLLQYDNACKSSLFGGCRPCCTNPQFNAQQILCRLITAYW